ncbi:MAG: glycosyltransferase, partial [Chloroflexota bacterium]|nr:glycosyltransferase [Chloroflexota bacterium]
MRRLLIVSYMFPPVAGVGIERTLKHVTYLPENGWQPVVIACANPGYRLVDHATLDRVPAATEVHRARSLEPAHVRAAARRLLQG